MLYALSNISTEFLIRNRTSFYNFILRFYSGSLQHYGYMDPNNNCDFSDVKHVSGQRYFLFITSLDEGTNDTMAIKFKGLSDRQKAVVETIRMRLTEKQSLEYLNESGFPIAVATFYREKRKIEKLKLQRLYLIAKIGFQDQHLERIDKCEMVEKLMWENYRNELSPFKKTLILREIVRMQPYLSAYYESTKDTMMESDLMKRYYIPEFESDENQDYKLSPTVESL